MESILEMQAMLACSDSSLVAKCIEEICSAPAFQGNVDESLRDALNVEILALQPLSYNSVFQTCAVFPSTAACSSLEQCRELAFARAAVGRGLSTDLSAYGVLRSETVDSFRTLGDAVPALLARCCLCIVPSAHRLDELADDLTSIYVKIIQALRQWSLLYSRLTTREVQTTEQDCVNAALERLTEPDSAFLANNVWRKRFLELYSLVGSVLFSRAESQLETWLTEEANPHHGPGAVAEGLESWEKDVTYVYEERFETLPYEYTRPLFASKPYVPLDQCHPSCKSSKISVVPKDYRKFRVIAAEPVLHQYWQQAFARYLMDSLHRSVPAIDFASQEKSRDALRKSFDGSVSRLATLDLSDASDTVRLSHLRALLKRTPRLLHYLETIRTESVSYQGKEVKITTAFPMGSALCFPMETAVFFAIVTATILLRLEQDGQRIPDINLRSLRALCRDYCIVVYGDDIIVRRDYGALVKEALEAFGFRPNALKCSLTGHFVESCGCDMYLGYDITPLRPRLLPGTDEAPTLPSIVSMAENFIEAGLFAEAAFLMFAPYFNSRSATGISYGRKHGRSIIPIVTGCPLSPFYVNVSQGRFWEFSSLYGPILRPCQTRWNRALQREEMKVLVWVQKSSERLYQASPRFLRDALARDVVSDQAGRVPLRGGRIVPRWLPVSGGTVVVDDGSMAL